VGAHDGTTEGRLVGMTERTIDGDNDGARELAQVGMTEGTLDGDAVPRAVGRRVGIPVG